MHRSRSVGSTSGHNHVKWECQADIDRQPQKLSEFSKWDIHSTEYRLQNVKTVIVRFHISEYCLQMQLKGNIHTISPGRNRLNFQILAYLLTIDLLYGTGCLSYWFCYYMLRLDSNEMLPGSQKGEEKTAILKPHARPPFWLHASVSNALDYGISMVGTGNDHVTPRDVKTAARRS